MEGGQVAQRSFIPQPGAAGGGGGGGGQVAQRSFIPQPGGGAATGVSMGGGGGQMAQRTFVPQPGAATGISTGPGAGGQMAQRTFVPQPGGGASTGPGAGYSTGPGAGYSTGPGAGYSTGPGAGYSTGPGAGYSTGAGGGAVMGPGGARFVPQSTGGVATGVRPAGPATGINGLAQFGPGGAGRGGGGVGGVALKDQYGFDVKVNAVPCAHCGDPIVGRVTNAMGKAFHPDHFVCSNCSQPFPDGAYIEHDGQAYCEEHYYELFAPRCAACNEPIKTSMIRALDKNWHPEHLTCQGCGKRVNGQTVREAMGQPYCKACRELMPITIDAKIHTCGMCKLPIIGEYIYLNNMYLHPSHFACAMCGKKLKNGDSHEWQGKNYCKEDFDKLARTVCAGCDKPITGRSIMAMGRCWHNEHFCCTTCRSPFNGEQFFEEGGLPYCKEDWKKLFANLCAKCNLPVVDGVESMGKNYHPDCFTCQSCDAPLKPGEFADWEGKPMCRKCYLKLPADVRKKIQTKMEQEAKMERKRQADARDAAKKREQEAKKMMKEAKKGPSNFGKN
eukprot:TRINITY_DN2007_c0_g1_i1.p1 TRINITY_DN2007_c0_g1~~TRINITY_DN2007_c0_g1_i1.p1  ORF type:complete len:558 (-),score=187.68 TRINITY_DN2007_c0_g1_i1:152-1825(-)